MNQHLITGLSYRLIVLVSIFVMPLALKAESKLYGAEPVVETKQVKGEVWPEVTVKVLIKATPLQAVAVFAAYDYQKNYIPNLLKSEVISEEVSAEKNDTQVGYKMDMPWPISDSEYIHGHELSAPATNEYKVRWYMVKSDSADNVQGYAHFVPHPALKDFTLMTYVSQVSPKSFFAGALKKLMVGDVLKSIEAIRNTTATLVKDKPEIVKKYSDKIRLVLSGKAAYLQ